MGLGPQIAIQVVVGTTALGARPMPGGQRDALVEKEQRRVTVGLPLRHPAASEREETGDPGFGGVVAHDVSGAATPVQATAVAHPRATTRDGDDLAQR